MHTRVGEGVRNTQSNRALELLTQARVLTLVPHSTARGVPLGGSVHARNQKVLLLDVGLAHALLATPAMPGSRPWERLANDVRGRLTNQVAGQQLRALNPARGEDPVLHYWQRNGGRPGEVGFLLQVGHRIVPVELKAGTAGAMKSLHQFVAERGLAVALRSDTNPPSLQDVAVHTTQGEPVAYRILNLPGHMLWRAGELLGAALGA